MKIAVLGSEGIQGKAVCFDLNRRHFDIVKVDKVLGDSLSIMEAMKECDIAINCMPFETNEVVSLCAIRMKCNLIDLGGSNETVRKQRMLHLKAKDANIVIIPDCGLAPGIPSILAQHASIEIGHLDSFKVYCGGLPLKEYRDNELNYSLSFSAKGLINEYKEDCVELIDGKISIVKSLSNIENVEFYDKLEAATTSGGISTLPFTMNGTIRNCSYKTLRYPGHFGLFAKLRDAGAFECDKFAEILEKVLPKNLPDVVLLKAVATGKQTIVYEMAVTRADGFSAMARATGFSAATMAELIADGYISDKGVAMSEQAAQPHKFISIMEDKGIKIKVKKYEN